MRARIAVSGNNATELGSKTISSAYFLLQKKYAKKPAAAAAVTGIQSTVNI
jgi:hypothetical protein